MRTQTKYYMADLSSFMALAEANYVSVGPWKWKKLKVSKYEIHRNPPKFMKYVFTNTNVSVYIHIYLKEHEKR